VPAAHFSRLLERVKQSSIGISCSADTGRRMPPAVFASRWFELLQALEGDAGAHALLAEASANDVVEAPPGELDDIDSQDDLRGFNR
ncbi:MAG: NTP transferase domain-containing protein, partial [Amphiplicatus sp.]